MNALRTWGFLLCVLLLAACGDPSGNTEPAFYHWRSHLELGEMERAAMEDLSSDKLYVKFFDVDVDPRSGKAEPLALLDPLPSTIPSSTALTPCVFITNRTFLRIPPSQVKDLATKTATLLHRLQQPFSGFTIPEIQIDCDWTASTQEAYFEFLDHFREAYRDSICLSATIRLHQYKFPEQTGVPPVDRGMLMAYNLGDLDDPGEENSILSLQRLKDYLLPSRDYPLELDIALPLFAWSVLIREGRPIRLLNNVRMADLEADSLMEKTGANLVEVRESHYFSGHYLYPGDILRSEAVDLELLQSAAELMADALPRSYDRHIAFYHLDTLTLKHYETDHLQTVFGIFD